MERARSTEYSRQELVQEWSKKRVKKVQMSAQNNVKYAGVFDVKSTLQFDVVFAFIPVREFYV